jgi:hypothetical protein
MKFIKEVCNIWVCNKNFNKLLSLKCKFDLCVKRVRSPRSPCKQSRACEETNLYLSEDYNLLGYSAVCHH